MLSPIAMGATTTSSPTLESGKRRKAERQPGVPHRLDHLGKPWILDREHIGGDRTRRSDLAATRAREWAQRAIKDGDVGPDRRGELVGDSDHVGAVERHRSQVIDHREGLAQRLVLPVKRPGDGLFRSIATAAAAGLIGAERGKTHGDSSPRHSVPTARATPRSRRYGVPGTLCAARMSLTTREGRTARPAEATLRAACSSATGRWARCCMPQAHRLTAASRN